MPKKIVVVGGGIAGLAVAYALHQRRELAGGLELICLEAGSQPGGNVRTLHEDGYICEWGPNGFLDNAPATLELVRHVGLEDRLVAADEQARIRWIWRRGRLRRVPSGPGSFLMSNVLSLRGRLRLLCEPLATRRPAAVDETVFDFAARRIGAEAARVLVGAMVTGVYAGNAKELSLASTFPKMFAMESEHGGLFKAMVARRREARREGRRTGGPAGPGGHLTSFRDGLQELPNAIARALGPSVRLASRVCRIQRVPPQGYRVSLENGAVLEADSVVLASPAWHAAAVVSDLDAELAAALDAIPSAPVAVIHLGYVTRELASRPVGFGFLVPRGEGAGILGTLFTTNIFPARSPDGTFLLTVMIGGAHDPRALELDDEGLVRVAREDLRTTMAIEAAPRLVRVFRHPRGIPQYTVGHGDRLAVIDRRLERQPGLFVHGNSYRGISVNHCTEGAPRIAEQVLAWLGQPRGHDQRR